MAIALVTTVKAGLFQNGGTTAAIDTTGATLLVLSLTWYTGSGNPVLSDSKGNTYVSLTRRTQGTTAQQLFYCLAPTVGAGHTFTAVGASTYPALHAYAFSGVLSFQAETGATTAGAGPLASGALTPLANGALVFAGRGANAATTDTLTPAGFAATTVAFAFGDNIHGSAGYYIQPTIAAINATWAWTPSTPTEHVVGTAVFQPSLVSAVAERVQTYVWGPM